jgi:alpha-ketoglutarate-dependent taurine dioxygenase
LDLSPVAGRTIGLEIANLDLSAPLEAETVATILDALDRRLVLVVRGQHLSDTELISFSSRLGELDPPGPNPYGAPFIPEFPQINVISNVVENGRPIGNLGAGEAAWHADMTYIDVPPKTAVLYALEIPPDGGGDTFFADMFAACEALPPDLKAEIAGKIAVHDASRNSAGMLRKGYSEVSDVRETGGASHPLVRTDPRTGRKALFLGRRQNSYVIGMKVGESEKLLDRLWAHATEPRFTMRHRWRVGDVLIWNNLAVLHRRDSFDAQSRRVMHRTQIKGVERVA